MDKRKLKQQQSILNELLDLEEDARKLDSPDLDLERTFELLQTRLRDRYNELKSELNEGPTPSQLLMDIDSLKRETQVSDPKKLKEIHKRVNELKTTVLFAPSPPKIDINPLLNLIDKMGAESDSDSDREDAPTPLAPPLSIRDPPVEIARETDRRSGIPFSSLDRQRSSSSDKHQLTRSDERQTASISGSDRQPTRYEEVELSTNSDNRSPHSVYGSNKRQESVAPPPIQADLFSPSALLPPGAFTSHQNKPAASSRVYLPEHHYEPSVTKVLSPTRRVPSPIGPRSPSPKHNRSSTPSLPASELSAKRAYHYFNPHTQTIELQDTTPDRNPQLRPVESSRRTMDDSRTPIREGSVKIPSTSYEERYVPQEERSPHSLSLKSAPAMPPRGLPLKSAPAITDVCSSPKIRRFFTEFTDFTTDHPNRPNFCTVEEMYSPTQFFIKSLKVDDTRNNIQIKVLNYVTNNKHSLMSTKSHAKGKLVLCKYSVDDQWYRACVIETLQGYLYSVLFLDYGNIDTTSFESLRDLPDELVYMAPMCVQQCYLADITPPQHADTWDPVSTEALWDLVSEKTLKISVQQTASQVYGVTLEIDGVNISDKLVEMGLAVRKSDERSDQMKGLCTSPTYLAPHIRASTTVRETRNRSPDKPLHPANRVPESQTPDNRISDRHIPGGRIPENRVESDQRNRKYPSSSSSSEDKCPIIGRPPTFGSSQPARSSSAVIKSPQSSAVPASFGSGGAVGRGNAFKADRPSLEHSSGDPATSPPPHRSNPTIPPPPHRPDSTTSLQDTVRTPEPNRWARHEVDDTHLPPPNFTISQTDLNDAAAVLEPSLYVGQQINRSTFDPKYQTPETRPKLKAISPTASQSPSPDFSLDASSRSECTYLEGTSPSDAKPRSSDMNSRSSDTNTRSSEVVVLDEHPSEMSVEDAYQDISPVSDVIILNESDRIYAGGAMDELERDTQDAPEEMHPQAPSLTETLQHIVYDPKSYLLGDITEEEVYKSYKKGEFTKLPIELIRAETRFLAAMVTSVQSPELFCVTILNNANIVALNTLNESLNHLYSNKPVWQMGDNVSKNVGGKVWSGKVLTINKNLLEVQWDGAEAKQWINADLVDRKIATISQVISKKLTDTPCRVELDKGEFCTARFTWSANTPLETVSWYRAMILEVIRKRGGARKQGKVIKYLVQFVDYGNVAEVDVKYVRPLPAKFQLLPAQSIPCFLPELEPMSQDVVSGNDANLCDVDEEDDDTPYRGQYSREAAEAFKDLVSDERIYLSVEGEVVPLHYGYRGDVKVEDELQKFRNSSLPVTIADIVDGYVVNLVTEYVNAGHADRIFNLDAGMHAPISSAAIEARMTKVDSTLAQLDDGRESTISIKSFNSDISSDVDSDTLSSFDPMSDDYNSETNLIDHDKDDVGQAVYGQKISQRTLCRFYSRGRKCYKGDKCPYLHQKKSDFHSVQSEQAMIAENKPPTPTNDMPIIAQVTSVLTPFHFWAQILPQSINPGEIEMECEVKDPLTQLTEKMNAVYKFKGFRECKYYPAIGEIVAVKSRVGNEDFRRSRVTETDDVGDGMCKVFHLDYGTFEEVHEKALRVMDPNFVKELPFQAQEMFLADIRPSYQTFTEPVYVGSEEVRRNDEAAIAKDFFVERVTGIWLIAKVIERIPEGPLQVHLWDPSGEESRDWMSINKELVDRGFAESVHPLPEELTTDCGTLASSNYQDSD